MAKNEHQIQTEIFNWARGSRKYRGLTPKSILEGFPEAMLLFAIPNGVPKTPAHRIYFQDEGLVPGVPDWLLPVARLNYHGFFGEMKSDSGAPTDRQIEMIMMLKEQGYLVGIFHSSEIAIACIKAYLMGDIEVIRALNISSRLSLNV